MLKKIAITATLGALSLAGCSAAPTNGAGAAVAGGTPSPSSSAAAPASPSAAPASPVPGTQGSTASVPAVPSAPATAASHGKPAAPASAAPPGKPATTAAPENPAVPSVTAPAGDGVEAAAALGWGPVAAGDEFSYAGAPDATKWDVFTGPGHAGQGDRRLQAWSVANGVATVTGDAVGATGAMSAKFGQQKYGRWETRMKADAGDSEYRPLLLLWPSNNTSPNCAEVDYADGTAGAAGMNFLLHYACGRGTGQSSAATPVDSTQWHNYAVEWTADGINGYIDGVKTFSDANPAHQPAVAMRQVMQLDWFPDGTATTPSRLHVDWVRVYN